MSVISARHSDPLAQESLADYSLYCEGEPPLLFTENETNNARLFGGKNASPYVKDGINDFVVNGNDSGSEPGQSRDEGQSALHPEYRAGRNPGCASAVGAGHSRRAEEALSRISMRSLPSG